jgi:hypothetical protein
MMHTPYRKMFCKRIVHSVESKEIDMTAIHIFVRSGLLTFPRWLRDKIKGRTSSYANSTENMDCGHVNFFTFNRMYNALAKHFTIRRVHHTTLFSGAVSHILFKNNAEFLRWNSTVIDKLPHAMSSGWYFVCSKKR